MRYNQQAVQMTVHLLIFVPDHFRSITKREFLEFVDFFLRIADVFRKGKFLTKKLSKSTRNIWLCQGYMTTKGMPGKRQTVTFETFMEDVIQ